MVVNVLILICICVCSLFPPPVKQTLVSKRAPRPDPSSRPQASDDTQPAYGVPLATNYQIPGRDDSITNSETLESLNSAPTSTLGFYAVPVKGSYMGRHAPLWMHSLTTPQLQQYTYGFPRDLQPTDLIPGSIDNNTTYAQAVSDVISDCCVTQPHNARCAWPKMRGWFPDSEIMPFSIEALSVVYMFELCRCNYTFVDDITNPKCPVPCSRHPCAEVGLPHVVPGSECDTLEQGFWENDFMCECEEGWHWISEVSACREIGRGQFPPEPLPWDQFVLQEHYNYRYGFSTGVTLESLVPGVMGGITYAERFRMLMSECAVEPGADEFCLWSKLALLSMAGIEGIQTPAGGFLPFDFEILSLAFYFAVCEAADGNKPFCPSPCGPQPCEGMAQSTGTCSQSGAGLWWNNYTCQCVDDPEMVWDRVSLICRAVSECEIPGSEPCDELGTFACQGFPDGSAICVCVTGFGGPRCEDYLALSRPLRFDEYNDPQMSIYQYGFPDGILLRDVAAGTYNQESYYWIFTSSLNQCKRRQPQRPLCVWDEMVEFVIEAEDYAHNHRGADVVPFGLEELSLFYYLLVCTEYDPKPENCPDVCRGDPCSHVPHTVVGYCHSNSRDALFVSARMCRCQESWAWDEQLRQCTYIDPCLTPSTYPCNRQNAEACVTHEFTSVCICKPPYMGSMCVEQRNACVQRYNESALPGATACHFPDACIPQLGTDGYSCTCPEGIQDWPHNEFPDCFVGEGVCSPYTCAHGVCQDVNGTMTCVCQAGYSGPSCEDLADICYIPDLYPCVENGTRKCESDGTTFNCICKNGYSGSGCGEYMSGPMTWAEMPSTVKDYIQGYPSTITLEYLLPGTYNGHSYPAVFRSFALECLMLHGRQGGGTCMWHWIQEVVSLAAQGQWEIPFSHEALSLAYYILVCEHMHSVTEECPCVGYGSGFELTKDIPYLALTGELWDVFSACLRQPCVGMVGTAHDSCRKEVPGIHEHDFSCECRRPWFWDASNLTCEFRDPCHEDMSTHFITCHGNGTEACKYSFSKDEVICNCTAAFDGRSCDRLRDACLNRYDVRFPDGYDACTPGNCTAHLGHDQYSCTCDMGHVDNADNEFPDCFANDPCHQEITPCVHGNCRPLADNSHATCVCKEGYEGASCDTASANTGSDDMLMYAAGGGGVGLVLLIAVSCWLACRKRKGKSTDYEKVATEDGDQDKTMVTTSRDDAREPPPPSGQTSRKASFASACGSDVLWAPDSTPLVTSSTHRTLHF